MGELQCRERGALSGIRYRCLQRQHCSRFNVGRGGPSPVFEAVRDIFRRICGFNVGRGGPSPVCPGRPIILLMSRRLQCRERGALSGIRRSDQGRRDRRPEDVGRAAGLMADGDLAFGPGVPPPPPARRSRPDPGALAAEHPAHPPGTILQCRERGALSGMASARC